MFVSLINVGLNIIIVISPVRVTTRFRPLTRVRLRNREPKRLHLTPKWRQPQRSGRPAPPLLLSSPLLPPPLLHLLIKITPALLFFGRPCACAAPRGRRESSPAVSAEVLVGLAPSPSNPATTTTPRNVGSGQPFLFVLVFSHD